MFDMGALELILIGVVALLVVGPERLPKLARTAGFWMGRARRAFTSVKDEIDREVRAEELKEILRKHAERNPLETIVEEDGSVRSRSSQHSARARQRSSTPTEGAGDSHGSGPPAHGRSDATPRAASELRRRNQDQGTS